MTPNEVVHMFIDLSLLQSRTASWWTFLFNCLTSSMSRALTRACLDACQSSCKVSFCDYIIINFFCFFSIFHTQINFIIYHTFIEMVWSESLTLFIGTEIPPARENCSLPEALFCWYFMTFVSISLEVKLIWELPSSGALIFETVILRHKSIASNNNDVKRAS